MMTEVRRIELSSVTPPEKDSKLKKEVRTFRLELNLAESNATSCPEYSYVDLIKAEREHNDTSRDPLFPEDNGDKEVVEIAQRFEAKYGTKSFKSGNKKQTQEMDDYYDVGDGYDLDDPFIDNTEAYDEVVPSTLTTKYGGFYINQGKLDFKSISEDSNDIFALNKDNKKNEKRAIESDSEEETGEALAKKFKAMKRKKLLEGRQAEKKKKLGKILNGDISIKKKKKKSVHKLKYSSDDEPSLKDPSPSTVTTSAVDKPIAMTGDAKEGATPSVVPSAIPLPSSIVSVNGNSHAEKNSPEEISMKECGTPTPGVATKDESSSKSGDEEKNTQLPSSLPPKLAEDIESIKQLAKNNTEGKSKFFSSTCNKLLLSIEMESLKLPKSHRAAIFSHMSEHLPSGKHALLRRAKKLRPDPVGVAINQLRTAVELVMPKAIEEHRLIIAKAKLDRLDAKSNVAETPTEEVATESDEEEGKADTKKSRLPRKKFSWTQNIIDLFLKVVQAKMKTYEPSKEPQSVRDEKLKSFFETEIKSLWPNGWMNTRALLKILREDNMRSAGKLKKSTAGKVSPVLNTEAPNQTPSSVSKVDDVIEISSIIADDDVEEKKNVVVNLPDSESKLPPSNTSSMSVHTLAYGAPAASPSTHLGKTKAEPFPATAVTSLAKTTVNLPDKVSSFESNSPSAPIRIEDSPPKTPQIKVGTVISSPIPKTVSPSDVPGASGKFSSSTPMSSRSFLQAFDSPSLIKGVLPSKPHVSLTSPKVSSISNSVLYQQQQQAKQLQQASQMLPKTNANLQQQKQEQKASVLNQKQSSVSLLSGTSKDYLSGGSSIGSSISTIGMTSPKQSTALPNFKATTTLSMHKPNLKLVNQRQHQANHPFFSPQMQPQNVASIKKKQLQAGSPQASQAVSASSSVSHPSPHSQKTSPSSSPANLVQNSSVSLKQFSSKPYLSKPVSSTSGSSSIPFSLNKRSSLMTSSPSLPGSQIKSGIVIGTSLPKFKPHPDQRFNISSSNTFERNKQQAQARSMMASSVRLTSPTKPLSVQTSLPSSAASSIQSFHPANSILHSSAASLLSLSRTSTPSPQVSPASPGNTAASRFDQIQSQIRNQEATQEQGLQMLAMAMKIGESATPKLGHGKKQN